MQNDDVRAVLERLKGLDLAERRLVVVDLLESDDDAVDEAAGAVDVGVGAGADAFKDLVLGDYFGSGMDAPALG